MSGWQSALKTYWRGALGGALVMAYNLWKTVAGARIADTAIPAPAH